MSDFVVRRTTARDFQGIDRLTRKVYGPRQTWSVEDLARHSGMFPEGQLVAVEKGTEAVRGMAASLRIRWDDYDPKGSWRHFTADGTFTNHDPQGETLYGAEVMVDPDVQGEGIGSALYEARRQIAERLGVACIRAGARLAGYHHHAQRLSPEAYVERVLAGELEDPTLSFQLHQGFRILGVVRHYLSHDPDSHGHAALIEWRPS